MTTIDKIHEEIDTASERLFQSAADIINRNKVSSKEKALMKKADELTKLGFTSAKEVALSNELKEKGRALIRTEEEAKLIKYYAETYPFLKFLTEAELDRICTKYGLIYAPADKYTGSIPDKNLEEIKKAQKLKEEDHIPDHLVRLKLNFRKEVPKEVREFFNNNLFDSDDVLYEHGGLRNDVGLIDLLPDHIKYYKSLRKGDGNYHEELDNKGLFIAGPKSKFNLEELKQNKLGYFKSKLVDDDPIVFRYVRGGIQVLTKWGKEADDIDLQIAKIN